MPDADWTPEMFVGLAAGRAGGVQFARRLAENGCRVIVPTLIDRKDDWSGSAKLGRWTNQPHREFIYRMAYEMGRHIIGYEMQKVLAAVDWFSDEGEALPDRRVGLRRRRADCPVRRAGGQPDQATRSSAATSASRSRRGRSRSTATCGRSHASSAAARRSGGFFAPGPPAAHRASPSAPSVKGPPPARQGRGGAAPGIIRGFTPPQVRCPRRRSEPPRGKPSSTALAESRPEPERHLTAGSWPRRRARRQARRRPTEPKDLRTGLRPAVREKRQFDQLVAFTQKLWRDSEAVREPFWCKVDTSSPEKYEKSSEPIRNYFCEEVIGKLPDADDAARTRGPARSTTSRSGRATRSCSTCTPTCSPTASCCCRRT